MSIALARQELKTDLETISGVIVYDHMPESLQAPAYIIMPDSPYVDTEGCPFGHYRVRFAVVAVADVLSNKTATDSVDELITQAAAVVTIESVDEPYVYQSNTAMHLAADLHISSVIQL